MPSAFVSKSLLTNSSFIDSFSNVCTTPSLSHWGIIYSFLVEYNQSKNVKSSLTLCWRKQPTTHTHILFHEYWYRLFYFESNQSIRWLQKQHQFWQFHHESNLTISSSIDGQNDLSDCPLPYGNNYCATLARLLLSCFLCSFCYVQYSWDQQQVGDVLFKNNIRFYLVPGQNVWIFLNL